MENYVVKKTVGTPDELYYAVVTNEKNFDKAFGPAKEDSNIIRPNFKGQAVVAVFMKSSMENVTLKFEHAQIRGEVLHVYYVKTAGGDAIHSNVTLALATVPKSKDVKTVYFYEGGVRRKVVDTYL